MRILLNVWSFGLYYWCSRLAVRRFFKLNLEVSDGDKLVTSVIAFFHNYSLISLDVRVDMMCSTGYVFNVG